MRRLQPWACCLMSETAAADLPFGLRAPRHPWWNDHVVLAATNKSLAKINKSHLGSKVTKRRNNSASVWKSRAGLVVAGKRLRRPENEELLKC